MNWVKRVIPDYTWDKNFAMAAFDDGRLLLCLNEYNWDRHGDNSMNIHWIVESQDGIISSEERITLEDNLYVSPNPVHESTKVYGLRADVKNVQYALVDITGKMVSTGMLSQSGEINFTSLKIRKGMYTLKLFDANGLSLGTTNVLFQPH